MTRTLGPEVVPDPDQATADHGLGVDLEVGLVVEVDLMIGILISIVVAQCQAIDHGTVVLDLAQDRDQDQTPGTGQGLVTGHALDLDLWPAVDLDLQPVTDLDLHPATDHGHVIVHHLSVTTGVRTV